MADQSATGASQADPLLNQDVLQVVVPGCSNPGDWVTPLNEAMARFDINDARRVAAFLAQIAHESNELRSLIENLNYSAANLMKVWPKRFPSVEVAQQYERNPEKIANFVYALRSGMAMQRAEMDGATEAADSSSSRGAATTVLPEPR